MGIQVDKSTYDFSRYVYPSRWMSYWHQIVEVLRVKPEHVLVVGVGDGIVVEILRNNISQVIALDIDPSLRPDVVASVQSTPFSDNAFDVVLCAEVLEHLPFDQFEICLRELHRIAKQFVILSLPHFGPSVKLDVKLPLLPELQFALKIPISKAHQFNGEHYWEIGKYSYPPRRIHRAISNFFIVQREFVPFENQYHHFYICSPRK